MTPLCQQRLAQERRRRGEHRLLSHLLERRVALTQQPLCRDGVPCEELDHRRMVRHGGAERPPELFEGGVGSRDQCPGLLEAALHRVEAGERLKDVRPGHKVAGDLVPDGLAALDRSTHRRGTPDQRRGDPPEQVTALVLEACCAGVLGRLLPCLGRRIRAGEQPLLPATQPQRAALPLFVAGRPEHGEHLVDHGGRLLGGARGSAPDAEHLLLDERVRKGEHVAGAAGGGDGLAEHTLGIGQTACLDQRGPQIG